MIELVKRLESDEIIVSSEPRNSHLIQRSYPVRSLASCAPALCGASSAIRAPLVSPLVAVGVVVRIPSTRARGSVLVQSTISDTPACSGQHTPGNVVKKLGLSLIRHCQLVSQTHRCGRREKLHICITGSGFPHAHHQHQARNRNHDRGAPPSGRHLFRSPSRFKIAQSDLGTHHMLGSTNAQDLSQSSRRLAADLEIQPRRLAARDLRSETKDSSKMPQSDLLNL